MEAQLRRAGLAALVIVAAFAVHLANQFWFEPRMGFRAISDYADASKLAVGLRSESWLWSGYAHFATAWALAVLALVMRKAWAPARPLAASLVAAFGLMAAFAFALTAVIDLPGRGIIWNIDAANAGNTAVFLPIAAFVRGVANAGAILLLGLFILHFTWCGRNVKALSWPAGLFGYIVGLAGIALLASPIAYGVSYLLVPLWALVTGIALRRSAARFVPSWEVH